MRHYVVGVAEFVVVGATARYQVPPRGRHLIGETVVDNLGLGIGVGNRAGETLPEFLLEGCGERHEVAPVFGIGHVVHHVYGLHVIVVEAVVIVRTRRDIRNLKQRCRSLESHVRERHRIDILVVHSFEGC